MINHFPEKVSQTKENLFKSLLYDLKVFKSFFATSLKNIVSDHIVPYDFKNDIINVFDLRKEETEKFVKARFFWGISGILWKGKKAESSYVFRVEKVVVGKEPLVILKDDKVLFSRLPTTSAQRDINLKMVLSYELSAVPLSLFHLTGEMCKTDKSQILHERESMSSSAGSISNGISSTRTTVIDFMAMLQSLNKSNLEMFNDLFKCI